MSQTKKKRTAIKYGYFMVVAFLDLCIFLLVASLSLSLFLSIAFSLPLLHIESPNGKQSIELNFKLVTFLLYFWLLLLLL